jgi:uncharacterized BrkB/YihY/UPF0761 family membrane protein
MWQLLGYLGLLPFVGLILMSMNQIELNSVTAKQGFIYYSASILSFLSGTLWRKEKLVNNSKPLILSNLFCLFSFACLFLPTLNALSLLVVGYITLLVVEYNLSRKNSNTFNVKYFQMRTILTVLVSVFHGLAFILWL